MEDAPDLLGGAAAGTDLSTRGGNPIAVHGDRGVLR